MTSDYVALTDLVSGLCAEPILNRRDNSFIRISGLYQCKRQIGYRILGEEKELLPSPHLLHIFDVGHALHYAWQLRLSKHGSIGWVNADPCLIKDSTNNKISLGWDGNFEVPVFSKEHRIRGTLDCLTEPLTLTNINTKNDSFQSYRLDPNGQRYIIDLKTITGRDNNYNGKIYPSSFEKLVRPKPEHILQASMYAWLTTQPDFRTSFIDSPLPVIPNVMLIYIAKDADQKVYDRILDDDNINDELKKVPYKVFTFPVDMNMIESALGKTAAIWDLVDRKELPGRDYIHKPNKPDYNCIGCGFRKACYSSEGYFASDLDTENDIRVKYKYKLAKKSL